MGMEAIPGGGLGVRTPGPGPATPGPGAKSRSAGGRLYGRDPAHPAMAKVTHKDPSISRSFMISPCVGLVASPCGYGARKVFLRLPELNVHPVVGTEDIQFRTLTSLPSNWLPVDVGAGARNG
jgi:hypothetical protein